MATVEDSKLKSFTDYIRLILKGSAMGVADVIPGISGGTIALIVGIYEDFINSIKSFDLKFVQLLLQFKIREAFGLVSWRFLGCILCGIVLAVFSLAKIISWLLENKPVFIYSFFFGLILATVPIIARIIKKWTFTEVLSAFVAAVGAFYLVGMVPVTTPETYLFVFLSGAIAISAMILPGISGSFILLLLGKYQYILGAVNQRDFLTLGVFVLGIAVGIVTFVRVLSWLFKKYHDLTLAIITGIVVGSLNKIWPWKNNLRFMTDRHGELVPIEQVNFIPSQFSGEVMIAIVCMVMGFSVALLLNRSKGPMTQL